MKKPFLIFIFYTISFISGFAQNLNSVSGKVTDFNTDKPLMSVQIKVVKTSHIEYTDANGLFILNDLPEGEIILIISSDLYITKRIPVSVNKPKDIDLGIIRLTENILPQEEHFLLLNEEDLYNDSEENSENITGLLTSSKDVFLRTAAYEFSSAFFKPRNLGSEFQTVMINGVPVNKFFNGRPQWSNWGGLNDVFRNQVYTLNISPSDHSFDDLGGSVNMKTQSSLYRKGFKFSYAASSRSYRHRFMGSYSSGLLQNNWSFTVSSSYRFANEGFKKGTVYSGLSFFTSVDKRINTNHSLNFTAVYADNLRGKSSPVTQEVLNMKNIQYNAYWGLQNDRIRNSRVKNICEPIFQLNHYWNINPVTSLQTSITCQFGKNGNSRIDYGGGRIVYDGNDQPYLIGGGKNPYPDYYQNLPSYFLKDPDQPDYSGAYLAEQKFLGNGQLNWNEMYEANQNSTLNGGNSIYALYEDRNNDRQLFLNTVFRKKINTKIDINGALRYQDLKSENFGNLLDLMGGNGYLDVDIYGDDLQKAQNDLQNINRIVKENERFKYNYRIDAKKYFGFLQTQYHIKKTDAFLALNFDHTEYQRTGFFENGAYPGNRSLGKSTKAGFYNYGFKTGFTHKFSGRHILNVHTAYLTKAPSIRNSFSNIRETNDIVDELTSEKHFEADIEYIFRHPKIFTKISTYFIDLKDQTHIGFYYADGLTGLDFAETTAFVQEILSGIDKRNYGVEIGVEIPVMVQWKIKAVAAVGQSIYSNNPKLYLTSDSFEEKLDYGKSYLKKYFVSGGPQQAYSLGFEYNSSSYWWFGATVNYFNNAFISIAPITRTDNFYKDIDGMPVVDYDEDTAKELLRQEKFDPYVLVNLVGGKSWKFDSYYIGFFTSITNLLNTHYKTGGFEQSRNADYNSLLEDRNREKPLFGPKYWTGYGTTFYTSVYLRW